MKAKTADLTVGSLPKQILFFSLPLIASNLLQVLFHMSDLAVVGTFSAAGSAALGSVGSTATLIHLFNGFLMGLGCGVNVLVANYFGADNREQLRKTVHTALFICAAIGLAVLAVGVLFARNLLELLNTKEDLIEGAILYMRIYFLGMPALALYNFGNAVFSAVGNTKRPLVYLFSSGILNVLLNLLFVIGFQMDVAGVAWASVISQYLSAALILGALFHSKDVYGLHLSELCPDLVSAKQILSIGLPAGLQNAIFQIANLFIQTGVNSFDTVMVEGNSAAANADSLVYDAMAAFYTACSSFIGQNFGAGKRERILKSYFISLGYSFGIAAVMGGALILFGTEFLSLFTRDSAVVDAGMKRLLIMALSYPFSAFMDNSIAASRGLGKTAVPTVIVILGSCVFRVVWIYTVFAYFHTIPSLYLLYIFSWTLTAVAEILYFAHLYRKQFSKREIAL
ncbi:MAG: MATE family efflux transporter [Clostridia bacterium]|nr:MATE family efflux transporter [Clostridia bacterium]